MDKLGVFLCTGCGIGDGVDVEKIMEAANEKGCAATLTHECLCAPEGIEAVKGSIAENGLNGILLGYYLNVGGVYLREGRVEGRCLSRTCGSAHKKYAVLLPY